MIKFFKFLFWCIGFTFVESKKVESVEGEPDFIYYHASVIGKRNPEANDYGIGYTKGKYWKRDFWHIMRFFHYIRKNKK